jgi:hypothetical protein
MSAGDFKDGGSSSTTNTGNTQNFENKLISKKKKNNK